MAFVHVLRDLLSDLPKRNAEEGRGGETEAQHKTYGDCAVPELSLLHIHILHL